DASPAVPRITRVDPGGGVFAFYPVAAVSRAIDVDLPETATVSAGVRSARDDRLVPAAFAYCDLPHATTKRFAALFHPQHPDWPLGFALDWPTAWAVLGWLSFAVTAVLTVLRVRRGPRVSPSPLDA